MVEFFLFCFCFVFFVQMRYSRGARRTKLCIFFNYFGQCILVSTGAAVLEEESKAREKKDQTQILFSYEEAIGFCIGNIVRDKDGVSAAAVFGEMSHHLYSTRSAEEKQLGPIAAELNRLNVQYGFFCQSNGHFYYRDTAVVDAIFARLRNNGKYVEKYGGGDGGGGSDGGGDGGGSLELVIQDIRDLTGGPGYDSSYPDKLPILPTSSAHMLTYTCVLLFLFIQKFFFFFIFFYTCLNFAMTTYVDSSLFFLFGINTNKS